MKPRLRAISPLFMANVALTLKYTLALKIPPVSDKSLQWSHLFTLITLCCHYSFSRHMSVFVTDAYSTSTAGMFAVLLTPAARLRR